MAIVFLPLRRPIRIAACAVLPLLALAPCTWGQAGDRAGETQVSRVPAAMIPPAPALSPEQALKTFKVQDGFRIELVASEPLVQSPVAIQFGPDGRLWVLEMRGFMPNVDGEGEAAQVGRISVLEDTNGDGRMDKSTVFLDQLVLPRAFMLLRDGVLVAEPPMLWFHRDTNGDGVADTKTLVSDSYAVEANPLLGNRANLEHSANSLTWALDNWIYSANYNVRFRNTGGLWERGATVARGQWGLSQDDYGRLFYNSNSDQLRADVVPAEYLSRNPNFTSAQGANFRVGLTQDVWPGRMNPGVNRGYQAGQLRDDFTLATFTAACAPMIYRGNLFPAAYRGNAFLCEPAGNLVRRNVLVEKDGGITATMPYKDTEFLVSTDERFRPVNLATGPDGAMYVVDLYRGILQHRVYVTSYLREQILSRELQTPVNQGRIYRVVPATANVATAPRPNLTNAASADLVGQLSHANGWWRDTAQRLLVERADLSVLPALRKLAASGPSPLGQIHALWTLDGLGHSDPVTIVSALKSKDPQVRANAIRVSESLLKSRNAAPAMLATLLPLANDPDLNVQRQLAFSLSENDDRLPALASILFQYRENALVRDAVFTSLAGRELEMLERITGDAAWQVQGNPATDVLLQLSRAVFLEGNGARISRLLDLAARQTGGVAWRQLALLDGLAGDFSSVAPARGGAARAGAGGAGGGRAGGATAPAAPAANAVNPTAAANPPANPAAGRGRAGATAGTNAPAGRAGGGRGGRGAAPLTRRLQAEPAALATIRQQANPDVATKLAAVEALLLWPGKAGGPVIEPVVPLTAEQEILFQSGRQVFSTTCAACHQPDGKGRDGLAPALVDSDWVTGSEERLIRIVLHGVRGPITVNGATFQGEMTPLGALDDSQLAAALTFVRRSWNHTASPVSQAKVTEVRRATASRTAAWTEAELANLP